MSIFIILLILFFELRQKSTRIYENIKNTHISWYITPHYIKFQQKFKMAELGASLTDMKWLHELSVGGAMAGGNANKDGNQISKAHGGQVPMRKAPNSPLDTSATLDKEEASNHRDGKPPYSYANLITFAINSSKNKKMTLSEIYQWICNEFPYYKDAGNGWKVWSVQFGAIHTVRDSSDHISMLRSFT